MHTSSGVDNIDEYLETVVQKADGSYYKCGTEERAMRAREDHRALQDGEWDGAEGVHRLPDASRSDRPRGGWQMDQHSADGRAGEGARRSHARDQGEEATRNTAHVMDLHTNSSNNTIYADADGNDRVASTRTSSRSATRSSTGRSRWTAAIRRPSGMACCRSMRRRASSTRRMAGCTTRTTGRGRAAGPNSPKKADFPVYVERNGENPRGLHALRVLPGKKDFTLDGLIATAYDTFLPEFETHGSAAPEGVRPAAGIKSAQDEAERTDRRAALVGLSLVAQIRFRLRSPCTGRRSGTSGDCPGARSRHERRRLRRHESDERTAPERARGGIGPARRRFRQLEDAVGEINRYQRNNADIVQKFNDTAPSTPVGFTSARWGSLASFGARTYDGTKKMYGTTGSSFVAVVEFSDRVRAKAVYGRRREWRSGSKHFGDQAVRYSTGDLRDVYFYPDQLEGHVERQYQPGK